jgi:plasmid replication initiation protein
MPTPDHNPKIIRKSNELIKARYKLSVGEQRLVLHLASEISLNDEDFKDYEIRVSELAKMFGLENDKSLYEKVEQAAESLIGQKIRLQDNEATELTTWLSHVKYIKGSGMLKLRFDKSIKPYLLQLKSHFTQYNLNHVIDFKSQYSIRFYELLKMDAFKSQNGQFEKAFEIGDLRLTLGLAKKDYSLFADFRIWVIEPAVKEINEKTDLHIENVTYGKTCRKMTRVTFAVTVLSKEQTHQKQDRLGVEGRQPENDENAPHPIIAKLVGLGFSEKLANAYKNKHGVKKIERNIAYTLAKKQEGVVKDVAAYLNVAITDDLGGAWDVKRSLDAEKSGLRKKLDQAKQAAEDEAKRLADERYQQAFAKFLALPEAEQDALKGEFAEATDHTTRASINKAQSKAKDMLTSPLVAGVFKAFLIEQKGF